MNVNRCFGPFSANFHNIYKGEKINKRDFIDMKSTSIKELGSQKQLDRIVKAREATLQKISRLNSLAVDFQQTGTREGKELAAAIRDQVGFAQTLANELGFKVSTKEYQVENGQKFRLGDTDEYFWKTKDEN